jgi:ATP-binding cassette, subfamily G (WHITE), member 2, SNQ2
MSFALIYLGHYFDDFAVVLGRPGSGCSTFLKTLANQRGEYHSVEGEVHYDSLSPDDISKHYRGDVTYCPEDDGEPDILLPV